MAGASSLEVGDYTAGNAIIRYPCFTVGCIFSLSWICPNQRLMMQKTKRKHICKSSLSAWGAFPKDLILHSEVLGLRTSFLKVRQAANWKCQSTHLFSRRSGVAYTSAIQCYVRTIKDVSRSWARPPKYARSFLLLCLWISPPHYY